MDGPGRAATAAAGDPTVVTLEARARRACVLLCALWAAGYVSCTPVREVSAPVRELSIHVDAAPEVRAELDNVEVMVESRIPQANSWRLVESQRFTPDPASAGDWPLELRVSGYDSTATYVVTATARDGSDAVKIQARAISEPGPLASTELRLRLDRECLRPSRLCPRTMTCSFGSCVDAREPLDDQAPGAANGVTQNAVGVSVAEGAMPAAECSEAGARTCALESETQPLQCDQGVWQLVDACAENERCDKSMSPSHGTCLAIATECDTRATGERYCGSAGVMFECQANRVATINACQENEQCIDTDGDVRCGCVTGFIPGPQGCVEASDCSDQARCEPLTKCMMRGATRSCTECPPGYSGTGESGCAPLPTSLQITPGQLDPAFDPMITAYQLQLPLLAQRIDIQATSEVAAELLVNGNSAELNA
ncbi:MAG TPA: hypothetical protein VMF89_24270, partial [Polyangiales bacterium]|nr:hypothetical protein [Polyangiales bacterium]